MKERPSNHIPGQWLLFIHQLPSQPDAFRVKIWRKLQQIGAISLKNSVYVLPRLTKVEERLIELVTEIKNGRGEAFLCDVTFIKGVDTRSLVRQFNEERNKSYQKVAKAVSPFLELLGTKRKPTAEKLMVAAHSLGKLKRQLGEVIEIDFFSSKERIRTESIFNKVEDRIQNLKAWSVMAPLPDFSIKKVQGKTRVTKKGAFR